MTGMLFSGRTLKNRFQFFQPATQLSPHINSFENSNSFSELAFSPHHILYSQIQKAENTNINSWRVVGLSTVLSLTCLLVIFYILKLIWQRFRTDKSEYDGLIQDSTTEWSAVEETDLNSSYGSVA